METGTSLSGKSLFAKLAQYFDKVPDFRNPLFVEIPLKDFLMSAFAIFELKFPSLLKFEENMKKKREFSNLKTLFLVSRVPSDTHMRSVVDEIPTAEIRGAFKLIFSQAQRAKVLDKFKVLKDYHLLTVDGSGHFHSDRVFCSQCIEKKQKDSDKKSYYHSMLAASFVHPDSNKVIPVCPEPIVKQDGMTKNDCEQNAMKRFLNQFRSDHPKLKTILVTDALHTNKPLLVELEKHQMSFILSVKPGSHEKLFEAISKWSELKNTNHLTKEEEIGDKIKKKRIREYRYVNGILLNHQDVTTAVNFLEFWETTQWVDRRGHLQEERVHFSWVTDFSLYDSNVEEMARLGRARWKIENETFNTLKNQGYEFEHNFGHGYKNLSTNLAMFMMLAFLVDQLQEIGCRLFGKALTNEFGKRSRLWEAFKGLYISLPNEIKDWSDFLSIIAEPENWTLTRVNTS